MTTTSDHQRMNINVVIDGHLLHQAMQASGIRNKRSRGNQPALAGETEATRPSVPSRETAMGRGSGGAARGRIVIVVDSSVWIEFFRGDETAEVSRLKDLLGKTTIAIGDLILVEVLQGFTNVKDAATARQLFRPFPMIEMVGKRNTTQVAANMRLLRDKGVPVRRSITAMVATACIAENVPLLFSDRDFQPFVDHLDLQAA